MEVVSSSAVEETLENMEDQRPVVGVYIMKSKHNSKLWVLQSTEPEEFCDDTQASEPTIQDVKVVSQSPEPEEFRDDTQAREPTIQHIKVEPDEMESIVELSPCDIDVKPEILEDQGAVVGVYIMTSNNSKGSRCPEPEEIDHSCQASTTTIPEFTLHPGEMEIPIENYQSIEELSSSAIDEKPQIQDHGAVVGVYIMTSNKSKVSQSHRPEELYDGCQASRTISNVTLPVRDDAEMLEIVDKHEECQLQKKLKFKSDLAEKRLKDLKCLRNKCTRLQKKYQSLIGLAETFVNRKTVP